MRRRSWRRIWSCWGYSEVVLKCDGEPALKAVQDEVRRRFEGTAICDNSPVVDGRSIGAAERAVQSVGAVDGREKRIG
eukprot:8383083-Lingulodinium_polyedra.AAC.1